MVMYKKRIGSLIMRVLLLITLSVFCFSSFSKELIFTEIEAEIPEYDYIFIKDVDDEDGRVAFKTTRILPMNEHEIKSYVWDPVLGVSSVDISNVNFSSEISLISNDLTIHDTNINGSSFLYTEGLVDYHVGTDSIPGNFFPNNQLIEIHRIRIEGTLGNDSVVGSMWGNSHRTPFIWSKDKGFQNPFYNHSMTYWSHTQFQLNDGDSEGTVAIGSYNKQPILLHVKSNEFFYLDMTGYDSGKSINLSDNGKYAIAELKIGEDSSSVLYDLQNGEREIISDITESHGYWGGYVYSVNLLSVSNDGDVAVGFANDQAVIWKRGDGVFYLKDYMIEKYDLEIDDWVLNKANHISPDGTKIYGEGISPNGLRKVWKIEMKLICEVNDW